MRKSQIDRFPVEAVVTVSFLAIWLVLAIAFLGLLGGCANLQPQVNTAIGNISSVTLDSKAAVHAAIIQQIQQDYQFVRDYNALVVQQNTPTQAPAPTPAQAPAVAAVSK